MISNSQKEITRKKVPVNRVEEKAMNHKSFNLYPYSHVPFIIHRNIVFKTFVPFTHVQLNSAHYLKNRLSFSIISNLSGLRGYDQRNLI